MLISLATLLATLFSIFRSRAAVQLENLALRHQIGVLRRSARERPKLTSGDLSLARIKSAFEMSNIQRGLVTCYMDDISAVAEFWRRTGDRCRERFTIKSWCLRRRDSATSPTSTAVELISCKKPGSFWRKVLFSQRMA